MTTLRVQGVSASYDGAPVLRGVDLEVPSGTTSAVLGPSGCGKTTLLRVVAGFQRPDAGAVTLDDQVVVGPGSWVPPERRGIGYVAQEGNLFPHLTVGRNIAFGLPRSQRRASARVAELLELVGLGAELAERRPDQLSGGQQQRVALARALALRPRLVLLDEPFSALDAGLRTTTRAAVAQALAHEQVTVVLVTHDQSEALSFADQVAIMRDGRFAQVGAPATVYGSPVDRESAEFLGEAVFLHGQAEATGVVSPLGVLTPSDPTARGAVDVLLRPEQITVRAVDGDGPPDGQPCGQVLGVEYFGHDALVTVRMLDAQDTRVQVRVPGSHVPPTGRHVALSVTGEALTFPR